MAQMRLFDSDQTLAAPWSRRHHAFHLDPWLSQPRPHARGIEADRELDKELGSLVEVGQKLVSDLEHSEIALLEPQLAVDRTFVGGHVIRLTLKSRTSGHGSSVCFRVGATPSQSRTQGMVRHKYVIAIRLAANRPLYSRSSGVSLMHNRHGSQRRFLRNSPDYSNSLLTVNV